MKLSLFLLLCCLGLAWGQRGFGGFFNRFFRPFRRQPQRAPQQQLQQQQPQPQQQQQQLQQAPQTSGGDRYDYSWTKGITSATWDEAKAGCERLGMKLVSLRNKQENDFIKEQIRRTGQRYIWTGGRRFGNTFAWSDEGMTFTDWSNTGGNRRPQPDNREGNENCLAVLNNFYNDGIKWHDVACHHRKPYVCERA